MSSGIELCWQLLYTKPRAEEWVEINLRKQGFHTLLPRVRGRSGFGPLFPRYLFAGFDADLSPRPLRSTLGVLYVVHFGSEPARVPPLPVTLVWRPAAHRPPALAHLAALLTSAGSDFDSLTIPARGRTMRQRNV